MSENIWFDQFGNIVDEREQGAYKAPRVISSASISGVDKTEYNKLKFEYPSLEFIKKHSTSSTHGVMVLTLPGVYSHNNHQTVYYRLLIDARDFPYHKPQTYVITPKDDEIQHCNIYDGSYFSVWPNKLLCNLCDGISKWEEYKLMVGNDLFGGLLNQISHVLKNPNIKSATSREVL